MSQYNLPDLRPGAQSTSQGQAPAGQLPDLRPKQEQQPLDLSPYSNEELLDAYKNLPRDDPRREMVKQRIIKMGNEPFERGIMSPTQSAIAGGVDTLGFGFSDEINAGISAVTGGSYDEELQRQRQMMKNAEADNPGAYLGGQLAGVVPQIAVTLGASAPATGLGRLGMNIAGGAAQSGAYGVGSGDTLEDRLSGGVEGAAVGAGLGALPSAVEGVYKGGKYLVNKGVKNVQKITNPLVAAEKDLIEQGVSDWNTYSKNAARAARKGERPPDRRFLDPQDVRAATEAGQTPMVSDMLGDAGRRRLDAAANVSADAANEMRGAAAQRQINQGQRVTDVVSDTFGDLNPTTIRETLSEAARRENKKAYDLVEQHPNAQHMWTPALQRALSTPEGKAAIKSAIEKSRRNAIDNGEEIIEPIFEEGPDGLVSWTGKFRKPTGEIAEGIEGLGLGFRFWDSIKRSIGDDIGELKRAGRDDAVRELTRTQKKLVEAMDNMLLDENGNSLYKAARSGAADFFGMEDAHEAGAAYFKNMGAFDVADARKALEKMKPAERELFARGYAAELVTRISRMGEAEDVNKLFKSPQARMKMRDALGNDVADQLEAYTHREMVQSLLGKKLGSNSATAERQMAIEGLKAGAGYAAAGGAGYYTTGDYTGLLAGLAIRGGYKAGQRAVIERYAKALAEVATSEDPEVIARMLSKISKDSGYMKFSRAVANGMGGGGSAAGRPVIDIPGGDLPTGGGRIEPRMPFAGGGLVEKAVRAVTRTGRSTVRHPVRKAFPGIYKEPRELLEDVRIEPEDPALRQLFGVTRDDLFQMSQRKGTVDDILGIKNKPSRGSDATDNIKTPRNAQRLVNALDAARENEGLWKGMHGWYVMDPAYQYLVREYGPEEGARLFRRFNTLTGMSSPGSEVMTELQRGTAANMMDNRGLWDEFMMFGGTSKRDRGHNFPRELKDVDGHPYHSTSQAPAMDNYLRTGKVEMGSAKVPTYIGASTPPELGSFTDLPVADAHFTRAVGLPDTRTAEKVYDHSMTMGEYKAVAPWYRDEVAAEAGIESVPAQAIHWGLFGPQTGVTTPVGSPKLELLARGIMETARRLGISPERARDLVLTGREHAFERGGRVSALGAAA